MGLLRYCFAFVASLAIVSLIHVGMVYGDQMDSFYKDFLIQRLRIAKVREFRGDVTARALLESLVKEAKDIGVELPKWSCSASFGGIFKNNFGTGEKVNSKRYDPLIRKASRIYDLPPALIKAVIHVESAFVADAVSHKGARGLMQLMPETAREINVPNPFNPRANVFGGSFLLRKYLNEFRSLKKTLIAYNAGPRWVGKNRIPSETRTYIRRVVFYYRLYSRKETRES